jgi:CRP/FNR family transcriptional regulator
MESKRDMHNNGSDDIRRGRNFLDKLSPEAQRDLRSMQVPITHGANVVLFFERDQPRGLFVVLEGAVRISIASSDGRRLSLKIARSGDILGLASAAFGTPYDVTGETLYPAKLGFIDRRDFARFLARHADVYPVIIEELNRNFNMVCEQLRTVALSSTAPKKLARLLLEWSDNDQVSGSGKVRLTLKHEEIGEFIGATRETVSRTLKTFKLHKLIVFQGSMLTIPSRAALENLAYS